MRNNGAVIRSGAGYTTFCDCGPTREGWPNLRSDWWTNRHEYQAKFCGKCLERGQAWRIVIQW